MAREPAPCLPRRDAQTVREAGPIPDPLPCVEMNPSQAILICDRDAAFRESLRNLLFAAGYPTVEVVPTVRQGLAKLRREAYHCVVVGISRVHSIERRLAQVVQRRQPGVKLLFVVPAGDIPLLKDALFVYVIKERAFSTLLLSLTENGSEGCGLQ